MSPLSSSPRLLKAAIVAFRPPAPTPRVIAFQINPETLTRQVDARSAEGDGGTETFRLAGAPKESIKFDAVFDATDALGEGDPVATSEGLHPQLAALETLLYPEARDVVLNSALMAAGVIEILPTRAPFTVFVWGRHRVLPVRLTSLAITEEAHGPSLQPIRAKVSMDLAVLSNMDLNVTHPGHAMFLAHHVVKETMAGLAHASSPGAVLGSDVKLL